MKKIKIIYEVDEYVNKKDIEKEKKEFIINTLHKIFLHETKDKDELIGIANYLLCLDSKELELINSNNDVFYKKISTSYLGYRDPIILKYSLSFLSTINPHKFNNYLNYYKYNQVIYDRISKKYPDSKFLIEVYLRNNYRFKKYALLYDKYYGLFKAYNSNDAFNQFIIYLFSSYYFDNKYEELELYLEKISSEYERYNSLLEFYHDYNIVLEHASSNQKRIK